MFKTFYIILGNYSISLGLEGARPTRYNNYVARSCLILAGIYYSLFNVCDFFNAVEIFPWEPKRRGGGGWAIGGQVLFLKNI